ncbi:MAG TPA: PAS domain S-box protein, partial [Halalkalibaculum sp.]|nr:PAS domain S-box protein [Halalkalibaculum sp.]
MQYLSERYELILSDCEVSEKEFDVCIVDRPSFAQNRQKIIAYKESKAPLTIPFLLFVKGENWSQTIDPVWNVVDDVVPIPTPTPILISRIEAMLKIRKHSLELQKKNEQLSMYEQAMNAANAGIVITDAGEKDNPIIFANKGFEKLTGYSKEEVVGRNCRFLQEEDREQDALDNIRSFISDGTEGHSPIRNYRKDGTLFWNDLNIAPITDSNGDITHFVGIQNNITDLVEAQNKLSKEKERYQLITDNATDMVVRNKPDGTFTYVSPSAEKLVGYKPEELMGRTFYEFFHPDDLDQLEETHEAIMNNPGTHKVSYRFKTKSGEYKWLESSIQAIRDSKTGEVTEVQGSIRDITERKEYEQKLEKERNLFKKLTESSPVGTCILDSEGQITFANEQAEQVLGLTKDKIAGLGYNDPKWKITDLEGNAIPEEQLPFMQVKQKERAVYNIEHAIEWPDGERRVMSVNAAPLKDRQGNSEGVIASIMDITESKQREKQLKDEREFVHTVINNMPGIFYMLDENLNFVLWNNNMVQDLGYSEEEIEDMQALDFTRPEENEYILDKIGEVLETGNAELEVDLIDKQGTAHRYFLIGTRLQINGENYITGSAVNISKRVEAEFKSEQQKKLLSAIINQTESVIYVKNKNGETELVNQEYRKLFDPDYPSSGSKVDLKRYKKEVAKQIEENDKIVYETG